MCNNKNDAYTASRLDACTATRLAKCHALSRKHITHPNVPYPDDPFIPVQVVHAPTNSLICNQSMPQINTGTSC